MCDVCLQDSFLSHVQDARLDTEMEDFWYGDEDAEASKASKKSRAPSSCADEGLPIDYSAARPCKCSFCGCSSNDENPLKNLEGQSLDEDRMPWGKYRRVTTASGVVRAPTGTHCALCRNVYRLLGFPHKHGAHSSYLKKLEQKQVDHTQFLASRAEYLKKLLAGKAGKFRTRKSEKDEVKAVTTLKTVKEGGVVFEGPAMKFIDVAEWDPNVDGVLDESKVVEEARVVCKGYVARRVLFMIRCPRFS